MISKTEKSIIGNIKMVFPLPLLLMLLFVFSFTVENFAQDATEPKTDELQTFKAEPGKMYLHIPPGEDFEEKKAAQIKGMRDRGLTFSVEDLVFLTAEQMDELKDVTEAPVANNGSYVLKWGEETINQNALVDVNNSEKPFTLYVDGQEVQLISNRIILVAPKTDIGTFKNDIVRRAITMEDGVLPEEFYEFKEEYDVNLLVNVFDLVYTVNGEQKKLEETTTFSVRN